MFIHEKKSYCPYCGETISLLIDSSIEIQEYIEDCEVCCNPIVIGIEITHNKDILMCTRKENE
ncbi:MAG: hypothetical protein CMD46_06620 [Gammaproteobacteria bacterium]|nr:hypothetical protein [Gammaproteobacteria bacterium]|tara:strand:- start:703 stop:891 length:189 start_codon:yes stop_codon:yes gene_type:complete